MRNGPVHAEAGPPSRGEKWARPSRGGLVRFLTTFRRFTSKVLDAKALVIVAARQELLSTSRCGPLRSEAGQSAYSPVSAYVGSSKNLKDLKDLLTSFRSVAAKVLDAKALEVVAPGRELELNLLVRRGRPKPAFRVPHSIHLNQGSLESGFGTNAPVHTGFE